MRRKRTKSSRRPISPPDFNQRFLFIMQRFSDYLSQRGYLPCSIHVTDARLEKYVAGRNHLKPLEPISDLKSLLPEELVHLYVSLKSDRRNESFFGIFYVNKNGKLVPIPEGYDNNEYGIVRKDLDEKKRLRDKIVETLLKHRREIWDTITDIVNLVIEFMRYRGG